MGRAGDILQGVPSQKLLKVTEEHASVKCTGFGGKLPDADYPGLAAE